jgi:hypothetical protein
VRLGLPREWLEALPEIGELLGRYEGYGPPDGEDAFLVWKAQEHLARTGRLAECDPMLVAEALESEAANDGPRWLRKAQKHLMFILAWPGRTYHLHVDLRMAVDRLRACLEESPSMWLLLEERREDSWQSARFKALSLDETLERQLLEACPWPTLQDLFRAAQERLTADGKRFY